MGESKKTSVPLADWPSFGGGAQPEDYFGYQCSTRNVRDSRKVFLIMLEQMEKTIRQNEVD